MPIDCTEQTLFEYVESIAGNLHCKTIYPAMTEINRGSIDNRARAALRDIERRHDVNIYYLCDRKHDEHPVDRILINLSARIGNSRFYSKTLPGFIEDLHENMDFSLQYSPYQYQSMRQGVLWNRGQSYMSPNCDVHKDHDSIYGLALAQPIVEYLKAVLGPDETCLLVASDTLSLPTAYAQKIAHEDSMFKDVKILFYAEEVHPIRNLITGMTLPDLPGLGSVGGFDWEGPIRCLISQALASAESNGNGIPRLDQYFLDFKPFRAFASDLTLQLMQHAWKLGNFAAPSHNIQDQLIFLDRHFVSKGKIPLFAPTANSIPCDADVKELCRQKLISYAQVVWGFGFLDPEKTIIATHIARAVESKAFPRDIALLKNLIELYSSSKQESITILLIIVTSWDKKCIAPRDYKCMKSLSDEANASNSHSNNFRIRIINEPLWPTHSEPFERPTALTRDDLHRATDVSLCLSTYDAFAIALLEPLSCGATIAVSTGCGCARRLQELTGWQENVLLVDYTSELSQHLSSSPSSSNPQTDKPNPPIAADRIFAITHHDRSRFEDAADRRAARELTALVPRDAAQRAEKLEVGKQLAAQMEGEEEIKKRFVPLLEEMFSGS